MGAWALIGAMLAMLGGAIYVAYEGWQSTGDVDIPISIGVAMGFGIVLSIVVGSGLMALLFYSSRSGHDDNVAGEHERRESHTH